MDSDIGTSDTGRIEIDETIFNPYSVDFVHDPFPTWQRLNENYPVSYHKLFGLWVVATHALNFELLKDPRLTASPRAWALATPEKAEADKNAFDHMNDHLLFNVAVADHIRLRKLTFPAFAKTVMDQIEAKIRDVIVAVFDAIGDADSFDAYEDVAAQIPVRTITHMVGVPKDAEELFEHGFVHNLVLIGNPLYPMDQRIAAMNATIPGIELLRGLIAERRALADPGDDFLGTLVGTVQNGDRLSDMEIIALVGAVISAGADTATDLHTFAIQELLQNPEQWQLLQREPARINDAIHEILRCSSAGKMGLYQFALQDCVIGGQKIRKGEAIMKAITAAWNDPARWPDPRRFDITRSAEHGLVFGVGPHFCIGSSLVNVQGKVMIEELSRRFPKATLAGDVAYDYTHHNARRIVKMRVNTNLA